MTFAKTPIMSTYLLAFVVGEFDYVEDHTEDGIQVRVYTPLGKAEQGRFALEVNADPFMILGITGILSIQFIFIYLINFIFNYVIFL